MRIFHRTYPWMVAILGLLSSGYLIAGQGFSLTPSLLLFIVLAALAERMVIRLPQSSLTLSFVLVLLTLLIGGPSQVAIVIVIGSLIGYGLLRRKSWPRTLFYVGHYGLASAAAGGMFILGERHLPHWILASIHLPAVAGYILTYALLSHTLIWFRNRAIIAPYEARFPKTDLLVVFLLTPPPLLLYYLFTIRDFTALLLVLFPLLAVMAAFRAYVNIDTDYDEVYLLYEVSQDFMVALTQEETTQVMAERISRGIRRLVNCDNCVIYAHPPNSSELRLIYSRDGGEMPPVVTPGHGVLGHIVHDGRGTIVNEVKEEPLGNEPPGDEPLAIALLATPLMAESELAGWLMLIRQGRGFEADNLRLVSILANQAGVLLKNAQMYEQTRQLTQIDPLLEILNRRTFMERARFELGQAQLDGRRAAMIMADIDDFRLTNNTYGHQVGDSVLQGVAQILRDSVGERGLVGRYGGEEFVIFLPHMGDTEAEEIAERTRRKVAQAEFTDLGHGELRTTISAGVAFFPDDALDLSSLIRKADQAAYLAKHMGKNRICLHTQREKEEMGEGR